MKVLVYFLLHMGIALLSGAWLVLFVPVGLVDRWLTRQEAQAEIAWLIALAEQKTKAGRKP